MKQRHAMQQGSLLDMPVPERKAERPSLSEAEKKMSRLEELIAELCPDGVEYKELGDICIYAKDRISASQVNEHTYVGVDNLLPDKAGKTLSNYVPEEGKLIKFDKGDILIGNIRPYLRKIWLSDCTGGTNGDVLVIKIKYKQIYSKFLYYILSSDQFFCMIYNHQKVQKCQEVIRIIY